MSELDIPEFIEKNKQFINNNKYGYDYWIWKPKIMLDMLFKYKSLNACYAGLLIIKKIKNQLI